MVFVRPVLLLAAVVALAGASPSVSSEATRPSAGPTFPPMLGISYASYDAQGGKLAWFDPLTLRMRPGRKAPLGEYLGSWAFSADRRLFAAARCGRRGVPAGIRLVNARTMRVLGDLRLSPNGDCATSLTWLRSDRLLAVVRGPEGAEVVAVDPVARRVVARAALPAFPTSAVRSRDELVLLLSSFGRIAPARVAVVDGDGMLRTVTVERVLEGTIVDEERDYRSQVVRPGLAVDAEGRRAFLVPAAGEVAEIDLRTLGVSYRQLDRPSTLRRLAGWLFPAAQAKGPMEGPERHAYYLGDGMIAVSGIDWSLAGEGAPAGLKVIDTRSWTTTLLTPEPIDFVVASGLVIVRDGNGLVAFDVHGHPRWRIRLGDVLRPSEYGWIGVAGRVGYVHRAEGRAQVIDVVTAKVLGTIRRDERRNPWPQLLAANESAW